MREDIEKRIRTNKPNISPSSVRTYGSIVLNLAKKMDVDPKVFLSSPAKVLTFLKDVPPNLRKTTLASLVVYVGDNDKGGSVALQKYRQQMMDDIHTYSDNQKNQTRTEKETANWIDWTDVVKTYKQYSNEYSRLLKKATLNKYEKQRLNDLVLLAVYTLIPPRRSEDYCQFKLKNIDKNTDNYMDGKVFVFNTYKTAKKYGEQKVRIPLKLYSLVKQLSERDDWGDYLIQDTRGGKLTPSKLAIALNKIFGKNISSSMLRKSFLSNKYKNVPALKEMMATAESMGHSFESALESYVKPSSTRTKKQSKPSTDDTDIPV